MTAQVIRAEFGSSAPIEVPKDRLSAARGVLLGGFVGALFWIATAASILELAR